MGLMKMMKVLFGTCTHSQSHQWSLFVDMNFVISAAPYGFYVSKHGITAERSTQPAVDTPWKEPGLPSSQWLPFQTSQFSSKKMTFAPDFSWAVWPRDINISPCHTAPPSPPFHFPPPHANLWVICISNSSQYLFSPLGHLSLHLFSHILHASPSHAISLIWSLLCLP